MAREFFDTVATKAGLAGEYEALTEAEISAAPGAPYTPGADVGVFRVVASRVVQLLNGSPIFVETFQTSAATVRVPSGVIATNDAQDGRFYFIKNSSGATGAITIQKSDGTLLASVRPGTMVQVVHGDNDDWDVDHHGRTHTDGGPDEIDGDTVDIDFTPTNYTPDTSPPEANDIDDLAAHLAGIDTAIEEGENSTGGVGTNYAFVYDTTTQTILTNNTYQTLTFNTNEFLDGWTHTVGTGVFTCNLAAIYRTTINLIFEKTGGGNRDADFRALFNSVEIAGSQFGIDITSNNTAFMLSQSFLFTGVVGQNLVTQISGQTTQVRAIPGPSPGGGSTLISASVVIQRIT
jgi:hypothetical protein